MLAVGFAVAAILRLATVSIDLFGVHVPIDSWWTVLSLCGLWLTICLWLIALVDLVVGIVRSRLGLPYIVLPGSVQLPRWMLPWLVLAGFVLGIPVGHLWW